MKWGFGWEQGPFEIWDAIGLETSLQKMTRIEYRSTSLGKGNASKGHHSFYKEEDGERYFYDHGEYHKARRKSKSLNLAKIKKQRVSSRKIVVLV